MADLTLSAVDSLVGLLVTAVTEEAKLLGGLQGDMQFIKDEMESINGFLIHLTKTEGKHDDQLRAWMKQVRDISYIAQDCIELYKRDFKGPSSSGLLARFYYRVVLLVTGRHCKEHDLASRIRDLKARVKDVGERRERYQVSIPTLKEREGTPPAEAQASQDKIDEAREEFVRALARDKEKQHKKNEAIGLVTQFVRALARDKEKQQQKKELVPCFDEAIRLLLVKDLQSAATKVRDCLRKNLPHEESAAVCMEMLLRALRDHSHARPAVQIKTKKELMKLVDEADTDIQDFPTQVMVFCYSKLSRSYKSCLQYLYAFHDEAVISRTSLVRRWLAEGRVEKQAGFDGTLEEAAELCFKDLLFRGFLLPVDDPATASSKVKSCRIEDTVWNFVYHMSTTENFVDNLPTHLQNQLRIRKFVKRQEEHQKNHPRPSHPWSICGRWTTPPLDDSMVADPDPMDAMINFLKSLDQTYRLNVLDLGGCKGLKKSHLKSICKVVSLKYLSLRNTYVSHLPEEINNLILLETLDIRQTKVHGLDMKHIYFRKLKHLLTSPTMTRDDETLHWAWMPRRIGEMEDMEVLSRVHVRHGKKELEEVGRLLHLRKLGVVLAGSQSQAQDSMHNLLGAIAKLRECLRSLSIWVTPPPTNGDPSVTVNMVMIQDYAPQLLESLDIKGLRLLNTGLPHWIWALQNLSEITLCDTFLSKVSLQDLGNKLHSLRRLRLRCNSYSEPNLTFNKDGFHDLRFLIVEGNTITTVSIEQGGAAPLLKKIVWHNTAINQAGKLSGIHHLKRLQEVVLKGNFTDPSSIPHNDGCKITEA
ncbi:disease resistance protein Pik-2-like [Aegilops tauschii subsp. strangulata]